MIKLYNYYCKTTYEPEDNTAEQIRVFRELLKTRAAATLVMKNK